jgi:hypothetical protein
MFRSLFYMRTLDEEQYEDARYIALLYIFRALDM